MISIAALDYPVLIDAIIPKRDIKTVVIIVKAKWVDFYISFLLYA